MFVVWVFVSSRGCSHANAIKQLHCDHKSKMRHWYDLSSIEQEVGQLLACVWQEINWPISLFWIRSQLVSFWLTPLVGMLPNVKSYCRVCLRWAGFAMVFDVSDNHYFSFLAFYYILTNQCPHQTNQTMSTKMKAQQKRIKRHLEKIMFENDITELSMWVCSSWWY